MFKNYFRLALRNIWKSKSYVAINVLGLSCAFCVCIFLFLTAYLHLTYDAFHADGDRIFHTYFFVNDPEKVALKGEMPLPLGPALKADYPELAGVTRVMGGRRSLIEVNGKYFDKMVLCTDPDFLTMFSFPMIEGNRENALHDLSNIVISERLAKAAFGTEDPVGKSLQIGNATDKKSYLVTGVISDAPDNSSIRYDALVRMENAPNYTANQSNWGDNSHDVYVKLPLQTDPLAFEERLKSFAHKYFPGNIESLEKKNARPDQRGDVFALRLQKLTDIHFSREISGNKGTPIAVIYVLLGLGFFILLIACINFINLNIARSFSRAREVGVRKSLGALKSGLFAQLWSESLLICGVGFLVGLLLAYTLLPAFNATFGANLHLENALQPGFCAFIAGVFLLVTLLAGGYPAWKMTRFNMVEVLKGKVSVKGSGFLRNSLIVTQFTMSCLLICCAVIAFQQTAHLRQSPLGFDKEQVVSIPVGNQANGRQALQRLRNAFADDPSVLSITGTNINLGKGKDRVSSRTTFGFTFKGKDISADALLVDYDYLKTLNIKVIAGRDFDRAYASDSLHKVIITQSLAKMMGESNPVGSLFGDDGDSTGTKSLIIGVIPDFQLYSVADEIHPISLYLSNTDPIRYVFVRMAPQGLAGSMDKLKKAWAEVAPQSEFMASFLDDNVEAWYQNEAELFQIFSLAAGIAILLSCIGLFAVALLVIGQRTKEIGIRKVMGASIPTIVLLLSRQFVKLVLLALAIAVPLAWFGMQQWLNNYTYRIQINAWVFLGVGLAAILVALASVSFQTVKAALANPIKSLRNE